jgi:transcriptional regulator with XRE-family HTH domain
VFSGQKLREIRKNAGLTGQELGLRVGISQAAISSYTRGHTIPTLPRLILLSDFLGVDINDFFAEVGDVA